jgi:hypothetical protein
MPSIQGFVGFGIVPMILQTAVLTAFIWLIFKLSRALDAYSSNLKVKT